MAYLVMIRKVEGYRRRDKDVKINNKKKLKSNFRENETVIPLQTTDINHYFLQNKLEIIENFEETKLKMLLI